MQTILTINTKNEITNEQINLLSYFLNTQNIQHKLIVDNFNKDVLIKFILKNNTKLNELLQIWSTFYTNNQNWINEIQFDILNRISKQMIRITINKYVKEIKKNNTKWVDLEPQTLKDWYEHRIIFLQTYHQELSYLFNIFYDLLLYKNYESYIAHLQLNQDTSYDDNEKTMINNDLKQRILNQDFDIVSELEVKSLDKLINHLLKNSNLI